MQKRSMPLRKHSEKKRMFVAGGSRISRKEVLESDCWGVALLEDEWYLNFEKGYEILKNHSAREAYFELALWA